MVIPRHPKRLINLLILLHSLENRPCPERSHDTALHILPRSLRNRVVVAARSAEPLAPTLLSCARVLGALLLGEHDPVRLEPEAEALTAFGLVWREARHLLDAG